MDLFKEILKLCPNSVTLEVNIHKDLYQSTEEYLNEMDTFPSQFAEGGEAAIIAADYMIELSCYPHSPNGGYTLYDHDYDRILERMYNVLTGYND